MQTRVSDVNYRGGWVTSSQTLSFGRQKNQQGHECDSSRHNVVSALC